MAERPEFSRPIRLDQLGGEPLASTIEADADERAALAARFGLLGLAALRVEASLVRAGDTVDCAGRLTAAVTQACVASGEPVAAALDEAFALRFVPDHEGEPADEVELEAADLDILPYAGGAVDLGEAAAQTLALALDPFPRAPGADAALRQAGVMAEEEAGPFAALKALRDRL